MAEPGDTGHLFLAPPGRTGEDAVEQPVEPAARSIWPIFRLRHSSGLKAIFAWPGKVKIRNEPNTFL
eukprot:2526070-Amphidinium_carterae.1